MSRLKEGDRLRLIHLPNGNGIVAGQMYSKGGIYTVRFITYRDIYGGWAINSGDRLLYVADADGNAFRWFTVFELLKETKSNKPKWF